MTLLRNAYSVAFKLPNLPCKVINIMNIEQAVLEKLRQLPIDKQQELLNFAEFLYQKILLKLPYVALEGYVLI